MALRPNRLALLGLLAGGPRHPYALHQAFQQRRLERWANVAFSSVYQVLGVLRDEGLVAVEPGPSEAGPGRSAYRLTPAGREVLLDSLRELIGGPPEMRFVVELALMFRAALPPGEMAGLLDARAQAVETAMVQLDAALAAAGPWQGYAALVFEHQRVHLEAERAFLRQAMKGAE